ncbi:NAD-binding protein [Rathayibacter sp. SD072]|uniref:NAD-binding protein n=1 Tax=Rathayibacter sp. SD072 TaxID=2781731 RepID=UPI001A972A14|nr:NAD-binding protein [Rathayibacter sp. SD072]MBO0985217.1 NAD-binding protein [Rathayibacter sp. SD072]
MAATAEGYRQLTDRMGASAPWSDAVYAGLAAFVLGAPSVPGEDTPLLYDLGRFSAPLIAASAAAIAFAAQLWQLADRVRSRRWRGHTVLIGQSRAAVQVAVQLAEAGQKVVILESSKTRTSASFSRANIAVRFGDGTNAADLRRSGVAVAQRVIAFTGRSDSTAGIAAAIDAIVPAARVVQSAFVEVEDSLAAHELERARRSGALSTRVEFFSLEERAAQFIVHSLRADSRTSRTVVLTGDSPLARAVVERLARETTIVARRAGRLPAEKLELVLVSSGARLQDEGLDEVLAAGVVTLRHLVVNDSALAKIGTLLADTYRSPSVLILDDDPVRRARVNLGLQTEARTSGWERIILATDPGSIEALAMHGSDLGRVIVLPRDVAKVEVVTWGDEQALARSAHELYRQSLTSGDIRVADAPWERLPPELQRSNIRLTALLRSSLLEAGWSVRSLSGISAAFAALPEELVERLAPLEHASWRAAKSRPEDHADWDHTSETNRELTRAGIRSAPAIFGFAQLELVPPSITSA